MPPLAGQLRPFLENRLVMMHEGPSVIAETSGLLDGMSDAERAWRALGRDTAMINALHGLGHADRVDLAHYLAAMGP